MPKSKERIWDPQQGKYVGEREVGQDEDLATKGKVQDTTGLAKKVSGSAFKPPAQIPGEDSAVYARRVAAARREWEAKSRAKQADAIK